MLLRVVGSCLPKFETGQTFEPTTRNNVGVINIALNIVRSFWGNARALHIVALKHHSPVSQFCRSNFLLCKIMA